MLDDSIEILYPDGSTSSTFMFPGKPDSPLALEAQRSNRKAQSIPPDDEPDDQLDTGSELSAQWTTVAADGEKLIQYLDGSEKYLDAVKLSIATCPVTQQVLLVLI